MFLEEWHEQGRVFAVYFLFDIFVQTGIHLAAGHFVQTHLFQDGLKTFQRLHLEAGGGPAGGGQRYAGITLLCSCNTFDVQPVPNLTAIMRSLTFVQKIDKTSFGLMPSAISRCLRRKRASWRSLYRALRLVFIRRAASSSGMSWMPKRTRASRCFGVSSSSRIWRMWSTISVCSARASGPGERSAIRRGGAATLRYRACHRERNPASVYGADPSGQYGRRSFAPRW